MITNFKIFESDDNPIQYSVGDIVVCSNIGKIPYIDQYGKFQYKDITYGKKYKVINMYWGGYYYNNLRKNQLNFNFRVTVKDIEMDKEMVKNANDFTLESKFKLPNEPQIGDYVLCKENINSHFDIEMNKFITSNIGRIVDYDFKKSGYVIEWRNIPEELRFYFWNTTNPLIDDLGKKEFKLNDIEIYSNNKKDIESIFVAKKYNIL
jgi:hypothetical protein